MITSIKGTKCYVDIESEGNTGRFGGELGVDGFYADTDDFSWISHNGEASDDERIKLIYDTVKHCENSQFKVLFLRSSSIPLKLQGDFIVLGSPARDRLELIYKGRMLTLCGECGGSYRFAAYTEKMYWADGQYLTAEEKLELIIAAYNVFSGREEICFIDDERKGIFTDWRGKPLVHIENDRIIAQKFDCPCGWIPQQLQLKDPAEQKSFKDKIIISTNNGLLLKKSSFFGRKKEYECRYCGSSWSVQDGADGLIWKKNIN